VPLSNYSTTNCDCDLQHLWVSCSVHTGAMAEVAMAAAITRSASVTDSPILIGMDALTSPVGAAGERVSTLVFFLSVNQLRK